MPRLPYSGTGTRRIPIAIQGGAAIKLCPPGQTTTNDGWCMAIVHPTAQVAVAATTLTIGTIDEAGCETGWNTTAGRLDGLQFAFKGWTYRITAQTAGGIITFERTDGQTGGLMDQMEIVDSFRIQSDLPALASKLTLNSVLGVAILFSYYQNKTAPGGEYFTVPGGSGYVVYDTDWGTPCKPMFIVGDAAGTVELEIFVP